METAPQPVVLTERQRRVLWLLSTGHTYDSIARDLRSHPVNVRKSATRIYSLMDASTAAQAVRNGLLHGHIGPDEDCGTSVAAYRRHIKRDEPVCVACKRGNRERMDADAARRIRPVELSKPQLRLLQALDAGRTRDQVADRWGISRELVKRLITATYAELGVNNVPLPARREAALREARARGLLRAPVVPHPRTEKAPVRLSDTHVRILLSMESGATLAQTSQRLNMRQGTCATRLSEAYRRLDVGWMDKGTRLPAALRRARAMGLLPEPAVT